jgi:pimeloyl-ACP methyl ester carboxylesterase
MSRHYVHTALGQAHVRIEGQGPVVLLLGSAGRSASVFRRLIPLLADRFTLVAPDLFGTGSSDPLPEDADIRAIAHAMSQVATAFGGQKAHVYGYHTGNKVATAMAANWPERVESLVLAGQNHSLIPSNEERNRVIGGRTKEYFAAPVKDEAERGLRDWETLHQRVEKLWRPAAAPDRLEALAQARAEVLDELTSFASTAALYRINFAYDLESDLRRVRARTLVLEIATPDEIEHLGPQGAKVCALIPGAQLKTIQADGFRLTLEDKAEELAVILGEFFAGAGAGAGVR